MVASRGVAVQPEGERALRGEGELVGEGLEEGALEGDGGYAPIRGRGAPRGGGGGAIRGSRGGMPGGAVEGVETSRGGGEVKGGIWRGEEGGAKRGRVVGTWIERRGCGGGGGGRGRGPRRGASSGWRGVSGSGQGKGAQRDGGKAPRGRGGVGRQEHGGRPVGAEAGCPRGVLCGRGALCKVSGGAPRASGPTLWWRGALRGQGLSAGAKGFRVGWGGRGS
ncbi:hypothetical protein NE237_005328 [Protea cynaroides]|uniref:Uncharacterized protein n=1 Tax=Protea cynaroides TaxID=273540 RepID=A0A9Q0KKM0_9MAGN|nr:hypothetical protein NE237_005328 [Protea cynaroides]